MTNWNADTMYHNPHNDPEVDDFFEKDAEEIERDIEFEQSVDFEERDMILNEDIDPDDLIEPDDFRFDGEADDFEGYRDEAYS